MSTGFNAEEILEMACQIERNGAKYYRLAAEQVTDETAKEMLLEFAVMEDDHEKIFQIMKNNLQSNPIPAEYLTAEAMGYIRVIADKHVFPADKDPSSDIPANATLQELLTVALNMENVSILFYLGLMEAMPEDWGHKNVRMIIREEMKHVALINDKIAAL